jgi:hypothetical protein
MDFIFAQKEDSDFETLLQGDLLLKTPELCEVLQQAHAYYAEAEDYTHFVVLTQSCDLMRREGKKKPKARYITLAAVRPFSVLLERKLTSFRFKTINGVQICDRSKEILAREFLERILHNTEPGYFFFKKESHPALSEDVCAFLALSVALRADHYDAVLQAKVGQVKDVFAAKIGWAVGEMYSKVATPDIEEHMDDANAFKERFYSESFEPRAIWLSNMQFRSFGKALSKWMMENSSAEPSLEVLSQIASGLGSDMDFIADRVLLVLASNGIVKLDAEAKERAKNALSNDASLRSLVKSVAI